MTFSKGRVPPFNLSITVLKTVCTSQETTNANCEKNGLLLPEPVYTRCLEVAPVIA